MTDEEATDGETIDEGPTDGEPSDEETTDDVSADERTTGEGPTDGEPSDGNPDDGDRLYVEDLSVGQTWDAGRVTFTEEDIVAFAEEFDPQPFHVDPEAAGNHFDGVIASGWHTAAACMRPFVTAALADVAVVAAVGIDDLRWHKPVSPGDTLSVTASAARPARGPSGSGPARRWGRSLRART